MDLTPPPAIDGQATVVVCTYSEDRWEGLLSCIASLRRQTRPPAKVIVVVDRNPALLHRIRSALPDVLALDNDAFPGAGGARNAGIAKVETEFVAFLDDDAEALPRWLEDHLEAYDDPRTAGTGGALEPAWETKRPGWFPPEFDWVVGCTYRGMPTRGGTIRNAISANMTARTSILRGVGGFRPDFGKVGSVSLPEDTDLGIRVLKAFPSHHWRYRPTATALHRVPSQRATLAYFCRRCRHEGAGKAQLASYVGAAEGLSSEREYTHRALPRAVARGISEFALGRDTDGLLRSAAILLGFALTASSYVAARGLAAVRAAWNR
jgi:glycosyltransferase involved in cell wall biosynthesis